MVVLNESELIQAQMVIGKAKSGIYELIPLYRSVGFSIEKPTIFGRKFKESVQGNLLRNICIHERRTNNHWTYKIGEV